MGVPEALRGMATSGKWTRRPVSVLPSATVNQSLGKGYRQTLGSRKSQGQALRSHGQVQSLRQSALPPHDDPGTSHCSPLSTAPFPHAGEIAGQRPLTLPSSSLSAG